jgi:predicted transcriptional regulator
MTAVPQSTTRLTSEGALLSVTTGDNTEVLRALASPLRLQILQLLHDNGAMNVNDIRVALGLPQSTIATNIITLEECGLVTTKTIKGRRGQQKVCSARFSEILVRFANGPATTARDVVEVAMPPGLYTSCEVVAPCGLCSRNEVIGLLDVPDTFLDPRRMEAALVWFGRGFVEYKFPNNARLSQMTLGRLELSLELASEAPGSAPDWPSDITLWVNDVRIGTWTSPGDLGGRRGRHTPRWWKADSSQFGELKTWAVDHHASYLDGTRLSDVTLSDLALWDHRSIRVRIGIEEGAAHPGGVNIFGKGFGDHDQDIVLRLVPASGG